VATLSRNTSRALLLATAALLGTAMAASAEPRTPLGVLNQSGKLVDKLQVSPSSSDNWGQDLLGRLQLLPNSGVAVNFTDGDDCRQDVRVTYHDRTEETRIGVDACNTRQISFDGSNAQAPRAQR
jgi:hypothetical protein